MNYSSAYWEIFYKEGLGYGNRVLSSGRDGKLSPEVIHGLAAMANEKMLMSLLLYHGVHPEGHTFYDLTRAVSKISGFDNALKESLIRLDSILPLCPMEPAKHVELNKDDVNQIIRSVELTREYVDNALGDCG
jgi:HEPN domain-containing protein